MGALHSKAFEKYNTSDARLVVSFLALHPQPALRRGPGCSDCLASLTVFPLGCLAGRVSLLARVPVGRTEFRTALSRAYKISAPQRHVTQV
jgi:hypothetical protein